MYEICITVNGIKRQAEATITHAKSGEVAAHVNLRFDDIVWQFSGKAALVFRDKTVIRVQMTKDTEFVDTYCGPISYKQFKALRGYTLDRAKGFSEIKEIPAKYEQIEPEVWAAVQAKNRKNIARGFALLWHTAADGRIGNTIVQAEAAA